MLDAHLKCAMMVGKMARFARTWAITGLGVIVSALILATYFRVSINDSRPIIFTRSILRDNDFVRNCITRKIIGKIPKNFEIVPLNKSDDLTSRPHESDQERKEAFEGIFKKRTWLRQQNRDSTQMVASG